MVLCDRSNTIDDSISAYGYDQDPHDIPIQDCGEGDFLSGTQRVCVVAVISDQ